jgi:DNA polymerase-1
MINLHKALRAQGFGARMILQVHDELVLEVPDSEVDAATELVCDVMRNAYPLSIPLKVDAHAGNNWGELK